MEVSIDVKALPELELLALEMAARGCVSGTLSEWPVLRSAFRHLGLDACPSMRATEMKAQAKLATVVIIGPPLSQHGRIVESELRLPKEDFMSNNFRAPGTGLNAPPITPIPAIAASYGNPPQAPKGTQAAPTTTKK